jgi:hypothetical protein
VHFDLAANSFDVAAYATQNGIDAVSDLVANSFDGAAYATHHAIDIFPDLAASTFGRAANATQHGIDIFVTELQIHLVELLMQFKTLLIHLLISLQVFC